MKFGNPAVPMPKSDAEPVIVRHSRYKNNCIQQDHRRIAAIILGGIELIHLIHNGR